MRSRARIPAGIPLVPRKGISVERASPIWPKVATVSSWVARPAPSGMLLRGLCNRPRSNIPIVSAEVHDPCDVALRFGEVGRSVRQQNRYRLIGRGPGAPGSAHGCAKRLFALACKEPVVPGACSDSASILVSRPCSLTSRNSSEWRVLEVVHFFTKYSIISR